jgi:hypothetical protein
MRNYWHAIDETTPSTGNSQSTTVTRTVDPWEYYVADYEADVEADTSFTKQTIEEEYNTYILSLPKGNLTLDMVKFWEVCWQWFKFQPFKSSLLTFYFTGQSTYIPNNLLYGYGLSSHQSVCHTM